MPAVADLPPKPPMVQVLSVGDAFGDEGDFVSRVVDQAIRHWEDRAEWILGESAAAADDSGFESVPLRIVGSVRVRYKPIGELKPMPYDWDE